MTFNPPPTPQQSWRMFVAGMLMAASMIVLLQYILPSFGVMPPLFQLLAGPRLTPFTGIAIHSPIKRITHYSRGFPVVALGTGDTVMLHLPKAGQEYVQVDDSIVKLANSDSVTVYRQYSTYTEICLFGMDDGNGHDDLDYPYSGLLKRERVPHPPLPPQPLTQTFWPLLTKQE
jgi:hypothetical protein